MGGQRRVVESGRGSGIVIGMFLRGRKEKLAEIRQWT